MHFTLDSSTIHRFERAIQYEWLETNGLGGFASSTVIGTHTRRYHGLLVAALAPPVGRTVLLSKMDETIYLNGREYELGSNKYQGAIYPNGYIFQQKFQQEWFPEFHYQIKGVRLKKTIVAINGENTTLILYEVLAADQHFHMNLLPMMANRDYHHLSNAHTLFGKQVIMEGEVLRYRQDLDSPYCYISAPNAQFVAHDDWYYRLEYPLEQYRGLNAHEDLFSPGSFSVELEAGSRFGIIVSTEDPSGRDPWVMMEAEKNRRRALVDATSFKEPMLKQLVKAADQFIVQRSENLKTIIAGYHWFSDWGRDSMIALPGLCLATGREADAEKILLAFAESVSEGMLPNRFPDSGEEPEYNTIDATLWFFVAVYKYLQATKVQTRDLEKFLPIMAQILECHKAGTRYNIHMDQDGLLTGGIDGVQLTWMDAKVDDWVVTPRIGKAVEINALWYNAWAIYAWMRAQNGEKAVAATAQEQAKEIKKQFVKQFWNTEAECLFDLINGEEKDAQIRPNQLFALSLPFSLLSKTKGQKVLVKVERELFTPVGLRSLSTHADDYQGHYGGDQYRRDGAYHQGTVWGWLIGPYIDAIVRTRGSLGRAQARSIVKSLEEQLYKDGIGTLSEIYDGNAPWNARGCIAQAWSVSEVLRVCAEYKLFKNREFEAAIPSALLELQKRDLFA
ncbi:MAG: amylo-alpha-1,6-glucosidase [Bacteroidota bacterium]